MNWVDPTLIDLSSRKARGEGLCISGSAATWNCYNGPDPTGNCVIGGATIYCGDGASPD